MTKLPHINHRVCALRQEIEKEGVTSVALPKLATGVGGPNWDDVKPLVENHLGDCGAAVDVYETYVAGESA